MSNALRTLFRRYNDYPPIISYFTVTLLQEEEWKSVVGDLSSLVDGKVDRLEFGPFRDELEEQLQALATKLASLQRAADDAELSDDEAAGIRKQLLQRFNCISCDKPVQMMSRKYVRRQPVGITSNLLMFV